MTKFVVFRNNFALFFLISGIVFGQDSESQLSIELGQTTFPIERSFTISVLIANSENRPTVLFPDIAGFSKKGISTSVTTSEIGGKPVTNQIITQAYQARAAGRFRLPPFTISANGETARSEGAWLVVQPSATSPSSTSLTAFNNQSAANRAAFLMLRASKTSVYAGEGVTLTLAFFVADNYPYELQFKSLDEQLQTIIKRIRPTNAWEENLPIADLKPIPVLIGGKKFREYKLYESIIFPLSNQSVNIAPISLWLSRPRPVIGPPSAESEKIIFTSQPVRVMVRPLPPHPLRGRVPVGTFQLEEGLERQRVSVGQSVRYSFTVVGAGNVNTLPAPTLLAETNALDIFPPEERQTINRSSAGVTGRKAFLYFLVPHQNGALSLADQFQWIYFNPQTSRYDTLHPAIHLRVGGGDATDGTLASPSSTSTATEDPASGGSLYTGLAALDSTQQPISGGALVRAIANVLIGLMLVGMIFVFFKR